MKRLASVLAALTAFVAVAQQAKDVPVILLYWDSDGATWRPEPKDVELAVWADGRVVWRDKPREMIRVNGEWEWNNSDHYRGKVDPRKVAKALAEIRGTGAIGTKDWFLVPPDGSWTRILVRDKKRVLKLTSSGEPSPTVQYGRDPNAYPKQLKAWQKVRYLATALRPAKREKIKAPNPDPWIGKD
jgi:hypothetical protein